MKAVAHYTKTEVHGLECTLLNEDEICRPWVIYQHLDLIFIRGYTINVCRLSKTVHNQATGLKLSRNKDWINEV